MKYRKKPVIIEAIQYGPATCERICSWMGVPHVVYDGEPCGVGQFLIETLEGTMAANPGDYIIKGVKGEFYPCKPDIFVETYEPVETADRPTQAQGAVDYEAAVRTARRPNSAWSVNEQRNLARAFLALHERQGTVTEAMEVAGAMAYVGHSTAEWLDTPKDARQWAREQARRILTAALAARRAAKTPEGS